MTVVHPVGFVHVPLDENVWISWATIEAVRVWKYAQQLASAKTSSPFLSRTVMEQSDSLM